MLGKLLCAAALVSAAFAQNIDITLAAGTNVTAGSVITFRLERPVRATSRSCLFLLLPPSFNIDTQTLPTDTEELSVAIGFSACITELSLVDAGLELNLYADPFDLESTNNPGYAFQNISVIVPKWFKGPAQLGIAHYYRLGVRISLSFTLGTDADTLCKSTTELQLTNTNVTVIGASCRGG